MTRTSSRFDCVRMKREAQEKQRRAVARLGQQEADRRRWRRVLNDPLLGAFVKATPSAPVRTGTSIVSAKTAPGGRNATRRTKGWRFGLY